MCQIQMRLFISHILTLTLTTSQQYKTGKNKLSNGYLLQKNTRKEYKSCCFSSLLKQFLCVKLKVLITENDPATLT